MGTKEYKKRKQIPARHPKLPGKVVKQEWVGGSLTCSCRSCRRGAWNVCVGTVQLSCGRKEFLHCTARLIINESGAGGSGTAVGGTLGWALAGDGEVRESRAVLVGIGTETGKGITAGA